ncbi:hypothetical protein LUX34_32170 [Streptomyces werraensis]|nr:hypothetical protein [Streptomyces werraensis]
MIVAARSGPRGQILEHVRPAGRAGSVAGGAAAEGRRPCPVQRLITGDVTVTTVPTVVTTVRRIAAPAPLPE